MGEVILNLSHHATRLKVIGREHRWVGVSGNASPTSVCAARMLGRQCLPCLMLSFADRCTKRERAVVDLFVPRTTDVATVARK